MNPQSNNKRYGISLLIEVDQEANFLEPSNGDNVDVIENLIKELVYDVDDIISLSIDCEVIE